MPDCRIYNQANSFDNQRLSVVDDECVMPNWSRFTPADFEYDFEHDKLAVHHVTLDEAIQCFLSDFEVRRNKQYQDRYQLIGRTLSGRRLKLIFQLKPGGIVRIITGWPL